MSAILIKLIDEYQNSPQYNRDYENKSTTGCPLWECYRNHQFKQTPKLKKYTQGIIVWFTPSVTCPECNISMKPYKKDTLYPWEFIDCVELQYIQQYVCNTLYKEKPNFTRFFEEIWDISMFGMHYALALKIPRFEKPFLHFLVANIIV